MRHWSIPTRLLLMMLLAAVAGCASGSDPTAVPATATTMAEGELEPTLADGELPDLLYRLDDELWVDDVSLGITTGGPARWRPNHPDQLSYISHSDVRRSGVFLFEQVHVRNLATGEEEILLDVIDHGWAEAGHIDWNPAGTQVVFVAREPGAPFLAHVLDVESGVVSQINSETQVIDTVFAPDERIVGIDTSGEGSQLEVVAWIGMNGEVEPIGSGGGVNRDPVVSPDGRYVANIRASGPLARVFIGRWDLVVTDLETQREWLIGDGQDGFGPPRWIDSRTLVAKHGRYNQAGIIAGIPDVVTVDVVGETITPLEQVPAGAWDPDPRR